MPPPCRLLIAQRAADGETRFVQEVGVNHRRGNVLVPKQILNGTDIVATFKQVRGKAVSERVTARGFCNAQHIGPSALSGRKSTARSFW